ncbi:guanyl-specific ribonuclease C2 [Armillaria mellea]|nr:guanyl-specific ribonuclease C2 [Armillaria mellea]
MATPSRGGWPPGPFTCGNNTYTIDAVKEAIGEGYGLSLMSNSSQGLVPYPHQFNNVNNLTMRCLGDSNMDTILLEEFPIRSSGLYITGDPGPDRVIYTRAQDGAEYCAVVAVRDDISGNPFVLCKGS